MESADNADPQDAGPRNGHSLARALGVGLGLLRSINPDIPVSGLIDTLRLLSGQPL